VACESLYDNFIADYYDASPIVAGRRDIDFYLNAAKEFGHPVLELGCGSGLVATSAALAGFDVVASDYYEDAPRIRLEKIQNQMTARFQVLSDAPQTVKLLRDVQQMLERPKRNDDQPEYLT